MIKRLTIIFLIFLILPAISAVEIEMNSEFSQGETLMAKVSGNFLEPILHNNIKFERAGHIYVPAIHDVAKIDDEFYIYARLGSYFPNENYSLHIENVKYMKGAEVSDEEIIQNFTINNETADFSVSPGFILTAQEFYLEVQNLQDFKIEIEVDENQTEESSEGFFDFLFKDFSSSGNIVELKSGEIKQLQFGLGDQTSFRIIKIKTNSLSYEIPVYVFVDLVNQIITSTTNLGENETENQTQQNQTQQNQTTLDYIEPDVIVGGNETQIKSASTKTCEEIEGIICSSEEKCSDESPTYTSSGVCCMSTCEQIKKSSSGKLLGWLMIGIIFIVLLIFFKNKSKYKRKKVDLFEIAKGKK